MSFTEAVLSVFSKYAVFSGRAGRPEFWWFALFNVITAGKMFAMQRVGVIMRRAEPYRPARGVSAHAIDHHPSPR
ncbi:DUF805 domain-containing protein [Rhizobium sp. LjRoot258]|uniref:DUF805 domain-containing protein n=1 Tax=Rhizobium sp. LjRoot258 TaxID=3342299 RepID=UPI003F4F5F6B